MPAQLLGAHMPIKGGVGNGLRSGHAIGCTAVQVFTSSPRQWHAAPVSAEAIADFKRAQDETGIRAVVSHDSYLINLCSADTEMAVKSFNGLKGELERCAAYGIPYVVSHIGSQKDLEEADALARAGAAMNLLLENTPGSVTLLMETTAGQGSSLNDKFEHLAILLELCKGHPRLGVCLDTCHVFAAGYPIHTAEGYELTFSQFETLVGRERLKAIHANDSLKPFGSRVDRHAAIGEGMIGPGAFCRLVNDPRWESVPILLETPDAETMHQVNLDRLKSYRGQPCP